MKVSDVISKLNSIKSGIIAKLKAIPTGAAGQTTSYEINDAINWYSEKINAVISAVNNYVSSGKSSMESDINDIITIGLQYLTFHPDDTSINLWEIGGFGGDGTFAEILTWTVDSIYIGYRNLNSHTVLENAVSKLSSAIYNEHNRRVDFHGSLMNGFMKFTLESLLEEKALFDETEKPPKTRDMATIIYMNWGLKDIIQSFNLDIYIPTYVR